MVHYVIDCYKCATERLNNLMDVYESIFEFLSGMNDAKPIMPPQLVPYYYCENERDVGISAFVLLEGGHFTIHTFPRLGCYFADLMCDNSITNIDYINSSLKKMFPSDSLSVKRFDRDDITDQDMEKYLSCDFGPHYMIKTVLKDEPTVDYIMHTLDILPSKVGMHPITRPCVLKSSAVGCPKFLSGIVIIAESHISMHYNYETKELYMDVFSCKEISDIENYDNTISELLGKDYSNILIKRGSRDKERQETQESIHSRHIDWQTNIGY